MNTLAQTNVERIQYDQTIDAAHVGLGNAYAEIQEKYRDQIAAAEQENEALFQQFSQESKSDQMAAAGRTGASVRRMRTVELGQFLAAGSRRAYQLTQSRRQLNKAAGQAAAQARQQQMAAFAQNNIVKSPDIAPPKPVLQNVGHASFMDALSIASSVAGIASGFGALGAKPFASAGAKGGGGLLGNTAPGGQMYGPMASDRSLKENIKKIGESISGLGVYKFNYIGQAKEYIGAMADEVIKIVPEAAILGDDGFYRVNYDLIDVTFKEA